MRALLLKPAALGAAIGLAFLGVALLFVSSIAAHASIATTGSTCGSPPTTSTLPTGAPTLGPGQSVPTTPATAAASSANSALPTTAAPTPTLCVLVQPYPSSGDALAGDSATYVVWVWSLNGDSSNVTVTASVATASYLGSLSFTICPGTASGVTCTIDSPPMISPQTKPSELLASVPVSSDAPAGTNLALTATATGTVTATGASEMSGPSSATDVVVTPTAAGSSGSNAGSSSLGSSTTVPPLVSLPPIPGTGVTPTNPSDLFPAVSPSQGTGTLGLPPARARNVTHPATETAYAVPVDPRLLGGQIIGLVALLGAVTIAIVRLSVRKPQVAPSPPADPAGSPPTA